MRTLIISAFFDENIVTDLLYLPDTGRKKSTQEKKHIHINISSYVAQFDFNVNQET